MLSDDEINEFEIGAIHNSKTADACWVQDATIILKLILDLRLERAKNILLNDVLQKIASEEEINPLQPIQNRLFNVKGWARQALVGYKA
jgi:hypothetical protein